MPERSFFIDGMQYPVCARDTGTSIAFLFVFIYGMVLKRYRNAMIPDRYVLILVLAGVALYAFDGASSYIGLRETTNALRLASGLMMGAGLGLICVTLTSFVLLGKRNEARTFTWRDIPIVYGMIAIIGLAIYLIGSGISFYYLVGALITVGYILLFFVLAGVFIALLRDLNYAERGKRYRLLAFSIVAEVGIFVILWGVHYYLGTTLP
ncbi:MAG: DUF2085 domain-containing protein [Euryarchaeota archaeon]|nr:DUF2085 domain-containing protein [Euryarchaeota archaeon]